MWNLSNYDTLDKFYFPMPQVTPLKINLYLSTGLNTSKETAKFSKATTLAVSEVVQFRNWNEPLQVHLALTGDPTEMM